MRASPEIVAAFAPGGALRASINYGNPILAAQDADTGTVRGVSVDLARALADQLGVPAQLTPYPAAGQAFTALVEGAVDIAFLAQEPARAAQAYITDPYVLIEGCYLVAEDSPITGNDQVDRAGHRVAVGRGSAYDLFLTRTLTAAAIERAPTSPGVVGFFLEHGLEVAAGVRQQLEGDAQLYGGLRVLPDRFMEIRQAMAILPDRGAAATAFLDAFVADAKASGFVAEALARHGIQEAVVAP